MGSEMCIRDRLTTAVFREDDPGNDAAHWVKGSVSIVEMDGEKYVQLNEDFEAGLAPDLYIYISTIGVADVETYMYKSGASPAWKSSSLSCT